MSHLKKLLDEFKAFAFKGNMIELAIAVIIGGAFGSLVKSLSDHVLMPLLSYIGGGDRLGYREWHLGNVAIGLFLGSLIEFTIQTFAIFLVVVKVGGMLIKKKEAAPTTRDCPLCLSAIPIGAKKCKFCTADLPN